VNNELENKNNSKTEISNNTKKINFNQAFLDRLRKIEILN